MGKTTKFIMSWKPVMSSMRDAMVIPNAVNDTPISTMKASAMRKPPMPKIRRLKNTDRKRIMNP